MPTATLTFFNSADGVFEPLLAMDQVQAEQDARGKVFLSQQIPQYNDHHHGHHHYGHHHHGHHDHHHGHDQSNDEHRVAWENNDDTMEAELVDQEKYGIVEDEAAGNNETIEAEFVEKGKA